jgi:hypothetical protein
MIRRSLGVVLLVSTLTGCRDYDLRSRLIGQDGLIPADQFARYGREQAEEMAVARRFGAAIKRSSAGGAKQADEAVSYARTLPDIVDVRADPAGLRLTLLFKSGWRTMVTPIEDGKR